MNKRRRFKAKRRRRAARVDITLTPYSSSVRYWDGKNWLTIALTPDAPVMPTAPESPWSKDILDQVGRYLGTLKTTSIQL